MTPSIYIIVLRIDSHTDFPVLKRGYFVGLSDVMDEVRVLNEALGGTETYPFYSPAKVNPAPAP